MEDSILPLRKRDLHNRLTSQKVLSCCLAASSSSSSSSSSESSSPSLSSIRNKGYCKPSSAHNFRISLSNKWLGVLANCRRSPFRLCGVSQKHSIGMQNPKRANMTNEQLFKRILPATSRAMIGPMHSRLQFPKIMGIEVELFIVGMWLCTIVWRRSYAQS